MRVISNVYLRYYVHVNVIDKFLELLTKYARDLVVGDPLRGATKMGPVVSRAHYDKIKSYVELAVKNGHKILCGETVE